MTEFDRQVAARTLAQETRGEPCVGQNAVAHVLRNRLETGRWGHSLASVCLWPRQFSGWNGPEDPNFAYACNLRDDDPVMLAMLKVLDAALTEAVDPTDGALFYYALSMKKPPTWSFSMQKCGQFGNQLFLKPFQAAAA